jgi:hypothetical protein
MARIVTCDQDVFTFYAPKNEQYDILSIQDLLARFGGIQMRVSCERPPKRKLQIVA